MAAIEESAELIEETEESAPEESAEDIPETEKSTPEETTPGETSPFGDGEAVSDGDASPSAPGDVTDGDTSSGDVSSGDVSSGDISSGDISSGDISGGDAPVVSPGTQIILSDNPDMQEILISIFETEQLQLQSSERIEAQNEAVISILLIIIVVGLLHYIYRLFKLFF